MKVIVHHIPRAQRLAVARKRQERNDLIAEYLFRTARGIVVAIVIYLGLMILWTLA